MRVLVACEFSGIVRDAFRERGHDAWSCDLEPCEKGTSFHFHGPIENIWPLHDWDLLIAHPPCTHLAVSGARWFRKKGLSKIQESADFFERLLWADVPKICIENPVSLASRLVRPPNQTIQPWQFGHPETKAICLWLVGLPALKPTNVVEGREPRIWKEPPGLDRWKRRSRFYPGIAKAMAEQWG